MLRRGDGSRPAALAAPPRLAALALKHFIDQGYDQEYLRGVQDGFDQDDLTSYIIAHAVVYGPANEARQLGRQDGATILQAVREQIGFA